MKRKVHSKNLKLIKHINHHKLTACNVAESIGMSNTSIYSFINARRSPSIESAVKLAHFLHVNVSDIFEEVMSKNGTPISTGDELLKHPEYKEMSKEHSALRLLMKYPKTNPQEKVSC